MSEELEYRCLICGLARETSDRSLRDAFEKYGHILEAKVFLDKFSGRSLGFGFVTFDEKKAMDEAIAKMNGMDLDGRTITVDKAQSRQGGSDRDQDGDRNLDRDRGHDRELSRPSGVGQASGGGDCLPGNFARGCPSETSRDGGGRYSAREDRYSARNDRYNARNERYRVRNDRYNARNERYRARNERYRERDNRRSVRGGRGSGDVPDRSGEPSRDGGSREGPEGERHSGAPYDQPRAGGLP